MTALDAGWWRGAVEALAAAFDRAEPRLCSYDGAIGDGDHGTSMALGFRSALQALRSMPNGGIGDILRGMGAAFVDTVGGVTGVVFGSLFDAMGQSAEGAHALDASALHRLFAAGLTAVKQRGKVSEGDKSLVDALAPVVSALKEAASRGSPPPLALAEAARAAEEGMRATVAMEARVGRARYQASRGRGHVDAGAASLCLLVQTLSAAAASGGEAERPLR